MGREGGNGGKVARILRRLERFCQAYSPASVTSISQRDANPFKVLISCILSLRTKDEVTTAAAQRLFERADTPRAILSLPVQELAEIIYPVGFYKTKSRHLHELSSELLQRHGGQVPDSLDALLSLEGVGRKTANLVLGLGFGKPAICVDTHVHRISNRLGLVHSRTPRETEWQLAQALPREHWIRFNNLMVTFGKNCCVPVSPHCSQCPMSEDCPKLGVTHSR